MLLILRNSQLMTVDDEVVRSAIAFDWSSLCNLHTLRRLRVSSVQHYCLVAP